MLAVWVKLSLPVRKMVLSRSVTSPLPYPLFFPFLPLSPPFLCPYSLFFPLEMTQNMCGRSIKHRLTRPHLVPCALCARYRLLARSFPEALPKKITRVEQTKSGQTSPKKYAQLAKPP